MFTLDQLRSERVKNAIKAIKSIKIKTDKWRQKKMKKIKDLEKTIRHRVFFSEMLYVGQRNANYLNRMRDQLKEENEIFKENEANIKKKKDLLENEEFKKKLKIDGI